MVIRSLTLNTSRSLGISFEVWQHFVRMHIGLWRWIVIIELLNRAPKTNREIDHA